GPGSPPSTAGSRPARPGARRSQTGSRRSPARPAGRRPAAGGPRSDPGRSPSRLRPDPNRFQKDQTSRSAYSGPGGRADSPPGPAPPGCAPQRGSGASGTENPTALPPAPPWGRMLRWTGGRSPGSAPGRCTGSQRPAQPRRAGCPGRAWKALSRDRTC
ncbi:Flavodoxin, partial [Dysosmobacter welbionis]